MTTETETVLKQAIEHMKQYGAKPQRVLNKRMATVMNNTDHKLGIKRPRYWAMGDQFVLIVLAEGPRIVMFV